MHLKFPCKSTIIFCLLIFLALREDRYLIAGRAIAVSLVHGGPPPRFLSPTLFACLIGGPEAAKPVLDDIADSDIRDQVKKVIFHGLLPGLLLAELACLMFHINYCIIGTSSFFFQWSGSPVGSIDNVLFIDCSVMFVFQNQISESASLEDLNTNAEPLRDYLANAGCLRPCLKTLADKDLLVQDILMFQVVHRVSGPFKRYLIPFALIKLYSLFPACELQFLIK